MAEKNVKMGLKKELYELPLEAGKRSKRVKNVPKAKETRKGAKTVTTVKKDLKKQVLSIHKADTAGSWQFPLTLVWRTIGTCVLLPMWVVTGMAFCSCFEISMAAEFWKSATFWFFTLGVVMWLFTFFVIGRPTYLYVWGHEATHALFTWISFGQVHEFKVTRDGGHIVTDKNNLLIALSPYFVPLYALVLAFIFWLTGKYFNLEEAYRPPIPGFPPFSWARLGYWGLGVAWGFHLTFTIWMIFKDQPDLKSNGTFFSLNVILLGNILLLSLLLVLAAPMISRDDFSSHWMNSASRILSGLGEILQGMQRLLGR